jgi:hypothetical protein
MLAFIHPFVESSFKNNPANFDKFLDELCPLDKRVDFVEGYV